MTSTPKATICITLSCILMIGIIPIYADNSGFKTLKVIQQRDITVLSTNKTMMYDELGIVKGRVLGFEFDKYLLSTGKFYPIYSDKEIKIDSIVSIKCIGYKGYTTYSNGGIHKTDNVVKQCNLVKVIKQ